MDLVPVSAEAARAEGGVWATLAEIALHHRVHNCTWCHRSSTGWHAAAGQQPTVFKLNTHAWL